MSLTYLMIPGLFYFPLLLVAKFGGVFLYMIPNPPTSQIWSQKKKKKKTTDWKMTMIATKQFEDGVCCNAKLPYTRAASTHVYQSIN